MNMVVMIVVLKFCMVIVVCRLFCVSLFFWYSELVVIDLIVRIDMVMMSYVGVVFGGGVMLFVIFGVSMSVMLVSLSVMLS